MPDQPERPDGVVLSASAFDRLSKAAKLTEQFVRPTKNLAAPHFSQSEAMHNFVRVVGTTISSNITAGTRTVTPVLRLGITPKCNLTISDGTNTEIVTVTAATATTFTAHFVNSYTAPITVKAAPGTTPLTGEYPGVVCQWYASTSTFADVADTWVQDANKASLIPGIYYWARQEGNAQGTPVHVPVYFNGSPAKKTIASSTNNLALSTGTSTVTVTTTNPSNLTGIALPTQPTDGTKITIINSPASSDTLTLTNLSGSSSAGNKIQTSDGNPLALLPGESATLTYDSSLDSGNGGYLVTSTTATTGDTGITIDTTTVTGGDATDLLIVNADGTVGQKPQFLRTPLGTNATSGTASSLTLSVTVNAGETLIVDVGVCDFSSTSVPDTVTWNGISLVMTTSQQDGGGKTGTSIWFALNTGATATANVIISKTVPEVMVMAASAVSGLTGVGDAPSYCGVVTSGTAPTVSGGTTNGVDFVEVMFLLRQSGGVVTSGTFPSPYRAGQSQSVTAGGDGYLLQEGWAISASGTNAVSLTLAGTTPTTGNSLASGFPTGTPIASTALGGTGANLSATGPGVLTQASTGSVVTVVQYPPITIASTPVSGGTVGCILFVGTGPVVSQDTGLQWDATNKALTVALTGGAGASKVSLSNTYGAGLSAKLVDAGSGVAAEFSDGVHTVVICNGSVNVSYAAGASGNWAGGTPPTDVWVALDRIAAALAGLSAAP